jgi:hypothetical protein
VNRSEDQNTETTDSGTDSPFELFESAFAKASKMDDADREAFLKKVAGNHQRCFEEILSLYLMWVEAIKKTDRHTSGSASGTSERTGVLIPVSRLDEMLHKINEQWCVIRVGNRTRYLYESEDGTIELYDKKSLDGWFSNWIFYRQNDDGSFSYSPILPQWIKWQYRRQYRGMKFCPEPQGAPAGVFNTYFGFSVTPQRGSWRRLKQHIYRNICQRNPVYFEFLMAWLAQLVQQPHVKPGTNIVLRGKEGTGKSKLGEWLLKLFERNAMVVASEEQITGRFNAHLENKLFVMAEEAFWAGDKAAEGALKDLATGLEKTYERKGLDPYPGKNYTRLMIASNEPWVVPASSGGRRWFVLEVGDEHEKDYAYFAAIDDEMAAGGLSAMLYDLQQTRLPKMVNVRSAPVTPWLVEQRLHSYDNKKRWLRSVLQEGGFRDNGAGTFVALQMDRATAIKREEVFASAKPYFVGPKGVDASPSDIGGYLNKFFGKLQESRPRSEGRRHWCTIFPPLTEMRQRWFEDTGENLADDYSFQSTDNRSSVQDAPVEAEAEPMGSEFDDAYGATPTDDAVGRAWAEGVREPDQLAAAAEAAGARTRGPKIPASRRH